MSKWLITGASGLLGYDLSRRLVSGGHQVVGLSNSHDIDISGIEGVKIDLSDLGAISKLVDETKPDVIVHSAGLTNVDACEANEELARVLHADVSEVLAKCAERHSAKMVYISTDHLWDGSVSSITENTKPHPINAYGRTKYEGEQRTAAHSPNSLIVRTNFFGPGRPWRRSFSDWVIDNLSAEIVIPTFTDSYFTPIDLHHLCKFIEMMVQRDISGIYNIAGCERVSKHDFAKRLAFVFGLDSKLIKPSQIANANLAAPRPVDMSLSVAKIEKKLNCKMPDLEKCIRSLKSGYID